MNRYYRFHAHIYQSTRWTFLFGRASLVEYLKLGLLNDLHLLEIGCGTGQNLTNLAHKYPKMRLTGVDIAPEMLKVAHKRSEKYHDRIRLLELDVCKEALPADIPKPDIIIISYCLTMNNPGFELMISKAYELLTDGGRIAVVDFHNTPFGWFKNWMQVNHVRMDAHLVPVLRSMFRVKSQKIFNAYSGLWKYFIFIGEK